MLLHRSPIYVGIGAARGQHRRCLNRVLFQGRDARMVARAALESFPDPKPLPEISKVKGICFDIDGTLCESDPLHLAAFQEILVEVS